MSKKTAPTQDVTLEDVLATFRASAPIFNALGDKFRQDIVMLLAQQERLNVGQIAEQMPLSRPAISHHLKVLLQAGLVQMERVSRENFYSLSVDEALATLRLFVEQAEVSCT
ncbi:metalloregulator ArsR/SmtB family transcription factor [Variovorax sp. PCZ-1]|uniref:ArsR/SmtB family transcription factor n=1 Tax=Variovorax sp. PCZ-1 TaxID=2835533 RepID=UPI001BCEEE25|nr:metalloregulator ArsR/SmtB family transcription factor [Variovorax sp. PCZ-1]MBS7807726.1 winged helix-turn-helix transcriptional regulator [Variovorax sp. PCZ-1]